MDHLETLSGDAKSISHTSVGFIILVRETALFLNSFQFCSEKGPWGSLRLCLRCQCLYPKPFYSNECQVRGEGSEDGLLALKVPLSTMLPHTPVQPLSGHSLFLSKFLDGCHQV